jgi:hypothetical protein
MSWKRITDSPFQGNRLFYRAYPGFYLNFFTLEYAEFSRVYPFPFPRVLELYQRVLEYFPCRDQECLTTHPLKHYAFLVLNCPEVAKEIYLSRAISSCGYLSLRTILDVNVDVVWDLDPALYEQFEEAVRKIPHVKINAECFQRCNEEWYRVKDSLTFEVSPLVARYLRQLKV